MEIRMWRMLFRVIALAAISSGCRSASNLLPDSTGPFSDGGPADGGQGDTTCAPLPDEELCQRFGKDCGDFETIDNCQQPRTVSCGACKPPKSCGGGGVPNVCGESGQCSPESDSELCDRFGKDCGDFTSVDNCGKSRTAICGTCVAPETCGGGGTQNLCGVAACAPQSDAELCTGNGKDCGDFTGVDNCKNSRTVTCGTCVAPETCGGGGVPNVCGSPSCTPESDVAFCARYGKDCDSFTSTDNCASSRTTDCGDCTTPETCGGGGISNVCGCIPEDDASFCSRHGKDCDAYSGDDNCGSSRTVYCGSCVYPDTCGGAGTANVCGCTGSCGEPGQWDIMQWDQGLWGP
jgi:hypothetical protein